ncbi:MAG: type II toxin-antitoxin system Phd/YefM family antitoxin [Desulfobacteraceae bacterium]
MEQSRVGIREAKIHLSRFLQIVKNGGEVILTERGKPVGKIVPIQQTELPLSERLKHLENKGIIGPRQIKEEVKLSPIAVPDDIAQKMLKEDRDHGV